MADLLKYVLNIPIVGRLCQRELRMFETREGAPVDLARGRWHPPVSARAVFESEVAQIENRLGLASYVSVTDHDDIRAGLELQALYAERRAPISFEWTVPSGRGFFHLGVHNLPPESAEEWFARLAGVTAQPSVGAVADALAALDAEREILVVFNHPLWDLAEVGRGVRGLRRQLESRLARVPPRRRSCAAVDRGGQHPPRVVGRALPGWRLTRHGESPHSTPVPGRAILGG
jgi:hypothetical protein